MRRIPPPHVPPGAVIPSGSLPGRPQWSRLLVSRGQLVEVIDGVTVSDDDGDGGDSKEQQATYLTSIWG